MAHSPKLTGDSKESAVRNSGDDAIYLEFRHRGESLVAYPGAEICAAVGGGEGVAALIKDLYRRIEQDELLREAFPHFNVDEAARFFLQWFGGSREYSDELAGGLVRRHQHRYISPRAAAAWLRCMREAVVARGLDAEPIMRPLARIASAMVHSLEIEREELCRSCDAVQDQTQVQFEALLNDAAKGRSESVSKALRTTRRWHAGAGLTTAPWRGSRRTINAGRCSRSRSAPAATAIRPRAIRCIRPWRATL